MIDVRHASVSLLLSAALAAIAPAQLYGVVRGPQFAPPQDDLLVTLDPSSGLASTVAPLKYAGGAAYHPEDIDFLDGALYGLSGDTLSRIDRFTGVVSDVATLPTSLHDGLAGDSAKDLFYTRINGLLSLSLAGDLTGIGPLDNPLTPIITYDDKHGVLYDLDSHSNTPGLYRIDTTTGANTLVAFFNGSSLPGTVTDEIAAAYDEDHDLLFVEDSNFVYLDPMGGFRQTSALLRLDRVTGEFSFVGLSGLGFLDQGAPEIISIAYRPVPETASLVTLSLGAVAFLRRRRPCRPGFHSDPLSGT